MENNNIVKTTTDYGMFKVVDGNRNLNLTHLRKLEESIKQNYLFTVILVNERFEIIDGQHRFNVIKKLGLPLNYTIVNNYGLSQVQILNQNSRVWNMLDYEDGYCKMGVKEYQIFKEFRLKYKFTITTTLTMFLGNLGSTGNMTELFKSGNLKIKNYQECILNAERILLLKPLFENCQDRSFVYSMLTLFRNKNFNFEEFYHKLQLNPTKLVRCVDKEAYIALIEEIYNYRRRIDEKVNLRF
jgi:hypothetical protein